MAPKEQPRWEIVNHFGSSRPIRVLHLSYHDGQHYASVRTAGEDIHRIGTPAPIVMRATAVPSSSTPKPPVDLDSLDTTWQEDMVLRSTTASNVYFVRAVLIETDGDTDAAIEYIIALSEGGDLEESVQREFAYEHGIFPEGGFPEDDIPSSSQPTPTTESTSTPKSTTPTPDQPSSELPKEEAPKATAEPSSASAPPSDFELDAQLMEHMTDEEMAMYLQQEESRLWSEGHDAVAAFLRATSPVEAAPSAPSTSSSRAGTSQAAKRTESASPNRRDVEEGRAKPYKGKPKASAAESASAPSASSKPVHPKLERLYVQLLLSNTDFCGRVTVSWPRALLDHGENQSVALTPLLCLRVKSLQAFRLTLAFSLELEGILSVAATKLKASFIFSLACESFFLRLN